MTSFIARILLIASIALLSACGGGDSGTTSPTTTARLRYITITPANKIIAVGSSLALTATGTYDDGTTAALTTGLTWTSTGSAVFSGSTVTGRRIGVETITATSGLISGTTKLTIKGAVSAAAAGGQHAIAQKADGSLVAWGLNLSGQLGDGTGQNSLASVPVFQTTTGSTWLAFAAGDLFSLGITSKGAMWGWGYNRNGQLGDGGSTAQKSPVPVGTATNWVTVAAGKAHAVALQKDNTLWTWGRNVDGQLGDGTLIDKSAPVKIVDPVVTPAPATVVAIKWVEVAAGEAHTMARQSDGTVWTWGGNTKSQLGNSSTTPSKPTAVTLPTPDEKAFFVAIAAGGQHSLAIRSDGTMWAWGANDFGQVGSGSNFDSIATPVRLIFDIDPKSTANNSLDKVAAGGFHTLAIMTDGTLWAWGLNADGQLGNDSTDDARVPQRVGLDKDWVAVAAGQYFSFALKSDGTLWAWGRNTSGELGIGSTTSTSKPTLVVAP